MNLIKMKAGTFFSMIILVPFGLLFAANSVAPEMTGPIYTPTPTPTVVREYLTRNERLENITPTPTPSPVPTPVPTPEPTPVPAPVPVYVPPPAPVQPDAPQWVIDLVCSYNWDCGTAIRILKCENRHFDPNVVNGIAIWHKGVENHATGFFQIMYPLHASKFNGASPFDAAANTAVAYELWTNQGFSPWACY